VQKLDGLTGQAYPAYTSTSALSGVLMHTDGTIFAVDGGSVVGIDPKTGQPKFTIALEQSIGSGNGNCGEYPPYSSYGLPSVGQPIIAGDGYYYLPCVYIVSPSGQNTAVCYPGDGAPGSSVEIYTGHTETHSRVLRVGTDGSAATMAIGDWALDSVTIIDFGCQAGCEYSSGTQPGNVLGTLITNADKGVLYSWAICPMPCTYAQFQLTTVSTDGGVSTTPNTIGAGSGGTSPVQPVLQGQDGTFVGTAADGSMVVFDSFGNQKWSVPNYVPRIATADGGVIAQSWDGTTALFDQNGGSIAKVGSLPTYSWKGAYQIASIDSVIPEFDLAGIATTFAAVPAGNLTGNGFSLSHHTFGLVFCGPQRLVNDRKVGGDGACTFPEHPERNSSDVKFAYTPDLGGRNDTTFPQATDFLPDHPEWVDTVKIQAPKGLDTPISPIPCFLHEVIRGPLLLLSEF
jgi:hypothetical protein